MSATMARQEGRVQLEQSDMHLALNMATMAEERFLRATIEETQQLIKKPRAEVRVEMKWGVVFPGPIKVKAAIARHLAMDQENQTDSCLSCPNGTAKNPQTCWRHKGTGAPPPQPAPPRPACHLCHLMTVRELKAPKQKACHPDMCIYILRFPALDCSIMTHLPRIACAIKIRFQIC